MIWNGIVEGVTKLGSQWLDGKQKIGQAKINFQVAKFAALANAQATMQKQTFNLDIMAVKEAAKTWWDEFLVLVYLSPLLAGLVAVFYPSVDAEAVMQVFIDLGIDRETYKYGLILIGVRYLGFRNLLRNFLQSKKNGFATTPKAS